MMIQTNMIIVPQFAAVGTAATPVEVCDRCGGLFAKAGTGGFFITPHMH